MILDAVQTAIRTDFETRFKSGFTAVLLDNKDEAIPESGLWASVTVVPSPTEQASIGNPGANRFRMSGVFIIAIRDDYGKGDKIIAAKADLIAAGYTGVKIGSAQFRTASINRNGRSGKWYQINVTAPWYADTIA